MNRTPVSALLALFASTAGAQTLADDEPIETIRPRVTDTTRLVPVGRFQLETGLSFGYGGFRPVGSDDFGQAVLRYGAARRLEVRLEAPSYTDFHQIDNEDGFGNASFSASYWLGTVGGTSFAVLPRLTLPTAVPRVRRPEGLTPSVFVTAERPLDERWTLASTVGGLRETFDGRTLDVLRATLAAERRFDRDLSAFAEYAGTYLQRGFPAHTANLGVRLRLSDRSQADLHWALPISNDFAQKGIGVGYAVRF